MTSTTETLAHIDDMLDAERSKVDDVFDEKFKIYHEHSVNDTVDELVKKPPIKAEIEHKSEDTAPVSTESHEQPDIESTESHEQLIEHASETVSKSHERTTNSIDSAWKRKAELMKKKAAMKPKTEITMGSKSNPEEDDEKMKEAQHKADEIKQTLVKNIEIIQTRNDIAKIKDIEKYYEGSDCYKEMFGFVTKFLFVPYEHENKFTAADLIREITNYSSYNPFDSPDINMHHDIAEMYVAILQLNKLFNHTFINFEVSNNSPIFGNLDTDVVNFLHDNADIPTSKIEYIMLKSFLSKLILSLMTATERAYKSNSSIYIDSTFKQAIANDILQLDRIQNVKNGKTYLSWKHFQEELFGMIFDDHIYKFIDYAQLNKHLEEAYTSDGFQIECLFANILKTFVPSIALNYFYVIKSIYILARLFGIYTYKQLYKEKSVEEVMSDLKIIANSATIVFECKGQLMKSLIKTIPKLENDDKGLSKESQMYFLSHMFTGPQYYLLKQLEYVFPVLANILVNTK